jgi:hypothetical protein
MGLALCTRGTLGKALFNGGLEIRVSEFRGAISSIIMGYEPCDFFLVCRAF